MLRPTQAPYIPPGDGSEAGVGAPPVCDELRFSPGTSTPRTL